MMLRVIPNAPRGGAQSWSGEVEGSYGRCRWRPDGAGFALWMERNEGPGVLHVGSTTSGLSALTSDAEAFIGWARASATPPQPAASAPGTPQAKEAQP